MRFLFQPLSVVFTFPLICFFVGGIFFHRTWEWLLSCCLAVIITFLCEFSGQLLATFKNLENVLLTFFHSSEQVTVHEVDIAPFLTDTILKGLSYKKTFALRHIRKRLDLNRPFIPLRAFVVRCSAPPFPAQLKAFSNMDGTSILFLRDRPESLSVLGRFKLYHELGHVSFHGTRLDGKSYASGAHRVLTFIAVIPTIYFIPWAWLVLVMYLAQQLFREKLIVNRGMELQADLFAFTAFAELGLLPQLLTDLSQYYVEEIESLKAAMHSPDDARHLFESNRLLHLFQWKQMLLQQTRRRFSRGKAIEFGRIVFDPLDVVMSLIFGYLLAKNAQLPGHWYFLWLSAILMVPIIYGSRWWRFLSDYQERVEQTVFSAT